MAAPVDGQSLQELQTQLVAMSYHESMGVESLALVRHLVIDLKAATQAHNEMEKKLEKTLKDAREVSQLLLPLRQENTQLMDENNKLHLEIIHQEEALLDRKTSYELELEKLQDGYKMQDQEVAQLQAQLEHVFAMRATDLVAIEKGNDTDTLQSMRRLSMDRQETRTIQLKPQAQVNRDMQEQLAELTTENAKLRDQCDQFNDKITRREQEISRLSKLLVQDDQNTLHEKLQDLVERYQTMSKDETSSLQVEQLSTQVNILNDQVVKYESRLKDATEQIRRNRGVTEKLQEAELDREYFVKELKVLQAKYHDLEVEHSRCKDSHRGSNSSLIPHNPVSMNGSQETEYHTNLSLLKEQVQTLTSHKDGLEDALRVMHYDKVSYTNALANATSHNGVLTSDLARAEAKIEQLTVEKANLEQLLEDAQPFIDAHTHELDELRESFKPSEDNRAIDNEKSAPVHRELRSMDCQKKEELMLQVVDLKEDLQKAKASLQETECEKEKMQKKIDAELKLQSNLEGMLELEKRKSSNLHSHLVESNETICELTAKQSQAQVMLSRAEEIENDDLIPQNETLALKRHAEELRDQIASLKSRVENDDLHTKRLSDQIKRFQAETAVANKKCLSLEKEKAELQNNYDNVMVELRNARQTWNHYQNEFEKLSNEVQAQQLSLSSGQNALQSSQSSVSDLKNQVRQLQSELKLKQNNSHHLETRLEQEKASHKSVQTQLVLLQDELLQAKETNRAREIALKQLRAEIQAKDCALTEKTEALENLKLLMEQMESSREQMVFQTKQRQQQIQRHQQEMNDLNAKASLLNNEISAKNSEIMSLKKLTRTLDGERDAVNDQLDALTERYHEMEKETSELRKAMQAKKSDDIELQEQMSNLVNKLNESEDKLGKMQAHCLTLENEIDNLEHLKGVHTAELAALAQDLENMTVENQAISEECNHLRRMEHSHSQSTKTMKQTTREIERERDTLQIELEDLRHTYRSLIQEHEGMQKARAEISALQEELSVVNESLRKQVATLDNQLQILREKNTIVTTEAVTYRDQVSFLTEKLQKSEEKQDDLQTRMQQLVQELDNQKKVSTEISAQRYGAQAENAAVSQRIVHLEAKLSNCKYEIKSLQDKLHDEQSRRRGLEQVASTLRQKVATNEDMISNLEEQRHAMVAEIQAYHQRQVPYSAAEMDMSELNHSPASIGQVPSAQRKNFSPPPSLSPSSNAIESTPESGAKSSSASSFRPLHALEEAQMKCQDLEDRLAQQDDTIKQLERSRSKFKRFAAKYEREIEQRDRKIEELQSSSHASSFVSPDARSFKSKQSRSSSSSSSSRSRGQPVQSIASDISALSQ